MSCLLVQEETNMNAYVLEREPLSHYEISLRVVHLGNVRMRSTPDSLHAPMPFHRWIFLGCHVAQNPTELVLQNQRSKSVLK